MNCFGPEMAWVKKGGELKGNIENVHVKSFVEVFPTSGKQFYLSCWHRHDGT